MGRPGNEANYIWLVKILDELYSLTSHTLHREKGSGRAATIKLLPGNPIIKHGGKIIRF